MDLAVRLTRAQLLALGACGDGLAAFDREAPDGILAVKDETSLREIESRVPADYVSWIGNVVPGGSGDGSGSGFGDGSGSGYGSGDGDGYGYGYGYGDGYGDGYGYGGG